MTAPTVEIPSLRAFLGATACQKTTSTSAELGLYSLRGGLSVHDIAVRDVVNAAIVELDAIAASVAAAGAPTNATYITLSTNGGLSVERVATAGTGITITDAGAGSTATWSVNGAFGSTNLSTTGTVSGGGATFDTIQVTDLGTGVVHSDSGGALTNSLVVNDDVHASAAIAVSKLASGSANTVLCGGSPNSFRAIVGGDLAANIAITTSGACSFGAATCTSLNAGSGTIQTTGAMLALAYVVSSGGNKNGSTSIATFSTTTTSESTVDIATTTDRDYVVNVQCLAKKTDETARAEQIMSARFKNVAGTLTLWGNGAAVAKSTLETDGTMTGTIFDMRVSGTNIRFGYTPPSSGDDTECTMIIDIAVVD
jgi:hypothetical protein